MNIFQNTLRVSGYIDFLRLAKFQQILTKSSYLPHGLRGKLNAFWGHVSEPSSLRRLSVDRPFSVVGGAGPGSRPSGGGLDGD